MENNTQIQITGGPWKGCLGIIKYMWLDHGRPTDKYMIYIDRLGTICVSLPDMVELTDEYMSQPGFDFSDPQVILAELEKTISDIYHKDAKNRLILAEQRVRDAEEQLENCKSGGTFVKTKYS